MARLENSSTEGTGAGQGNSKHTAINRIQIRVLALSVCHINMAGRQASGRGEYRKWGKVVGNWEL